METVRLYYENAFRTRFTARVLSCEPEQGGFAVALDRTAFYPEGGGQPCDRGTLSWAGGSAAVRAVREQDGAVLHLCDAAPPLRGEVSGELDWPRRFDHMQQHSGEHIFSGLLHHLTGFENVGFHLGAETVTVDFSGEVPEALAARVEALANEYIWADAPADIRLYDQEQLKTLEYRSKKALPGDVRIVSFPGADCCACCGTHVRTAGQVGLVKVLSCQKFREGSRLELVCGGRALGWLTQLQASNTAISQALSAKPGETAEAVVRLKEALAAETARAGALEEQLFALRAEALRGAGDTLLIEPPLSSESARRLAVAAGAACGGRCAVFAGCDGAWKYAVLAPEETELRAYAQRLNAALRGRGGGRDGFLQGSAQATEAEIRAFFA